MSLSILLLFDIVTSSGNTSVLLFRSHHRPPLTRQQAVVVVVVVEEGCEIQYRPVLSVLCGQSLSGTDHDLVIVYYLYNLLQCDDLLAGEI